MLILPLWIGTSRSSVFWERWGQITLISFCRSKSIWFLSSPPSDKKNAQNTKLDIETDPHLNKCTVCLFLSNLWLSWLQGQCGWGPSGWRWSGPSCHRPQACSSERVSVDISKGFIVRHNSQYQPATAQHGTAQPEQRPTAVTAYRHMNSDAEVRVLKLIFQILI